MSILDYFSLRFMSMIENERNGTGDLIRLSQIAKRQSDKTTTKRQNDKIWARNSARMAPNHKDLLMREFEERSFFLLESIWGMDVQQIEAVVSEDRLEKII